MNTASNHLKRFPQARSTTLAYLIEREKKNEQLRREVRAKRNPLFRLLVALRGQRG